MQSMRNWLRISYNAEAEIMAALKRAAEEETKKRLERAKE